MEFEPQPEIPGKRGRGRGRGRGRARGVGTGKAPKAGRGRGRGRGQTVVPTVGVEAIRQERQQKMKVICHLKKKK